MATPKDPDDKSNVIKLPRPAALPKTKRRKKDAAPPARSNVVSMPTSAFRGTTKVLLDAINSALPHTASLSRSDFVLAQLQAYAAHGGVKVDSLLARRLAKENVLNALSMFELADALQAIELEELLSAHAGPPPEPPAG